jgi:hypothetical protein
MEPVSKRHYKLLGSALLAEQRRALASSVPALFSILAVAMIASIFLGIWRGYHRQNTLIIAVFTGLYLGYVAFAIPRKLKKRLAKCWDTYDLEIGDDYFLRRQADTPDLQLKFGEVTRVERLPGRYLRIIGKSKQHVIGIPESIENFEEVLQIVSGIQPLTLRSGELWRRPIFYMAAGAVAFVTMVWSRSSILFTPLAVGLSIMVLWTFWSVRRNPNASRQTRRAVWWYLLILIPCLQKMLEGISHLLKR